MKTFCGCTDLSDDLGENQAENGHILGENHGENETVRRSVKSGTLYLYIGSSSTCNEGAEELGPLHCTHFCVRPSIPLKILLLLQ